MASSKVAANVRGSASYKKKHGTLSISTDQKSIAWSSLDGVSSLTIAIADITNLQQTPESSPKVVLKIFVKSPDGAESVSHMFNFDAPSNPRGEANSIKDSLTHLISSLKHNESSLTARLGSGSASAAMAIAAAATSKWSSGTVRWYDDAQLKTDFSLQESLLKKDPALHRTYTESRRTKPDSISDSQFNSQFWSTRTNVLRAHAVESHQKRGQYNVLSAVKPRQVDGELKMSISAEQVQLIFSQHPSVKRVYDDNVPKLNEMEFWSRFFLSRLFKRLKGEMINTNIDPSDPTFDRYLEVSNEVGPSERLLAANIPNIIDLEGNEENQGGSRAISGNRQDKTTRPSEVSKIAIVRTLNSLSEKIMAAVALSDVNPADPIGMDEETFKALALRDLQGDEEENRVILNVKEQSRFFSDEKSFKSAEAASYANQKPSDVLFRLQADIDQSLMDRDTNSRYDLRKAVGVLEESDSEEEEETAKVAHVGSKSSLIDAQRQILEGVAVRRMEIDGYDAKASLAGLSQTMFDRLKLTHATTTEFLHHFWLTFLSGDADRAGELAKMVETLNRAMDRITAVAADAEKERLEFIANEKKRIRTIWETTKRKIRFDADLVGGGEKVVLEMMEPTIRTLQKAVKEYKKALAAEGVDTL